MIENWYDGTTLRKISEKNIDRILIVVPRKVRSNRKHCYLFHLIKKFNLRILLDFLIINIRFFRKILHIW